MSISEIQLYEILKNKLGEEEAHTLVELIQKEVKNEFLAIKEIFLTKEDKIDIMKSIYLVGVIQFLAIVTSVIGTVSFMLR